VSTAAAGLHNLSGSGPGLWTLPAPSPLALGGSAGIAPGLWWGCQVPFGLRC